MISNCDVVKNDRIGEDDYRVGFTCDFCNDFNSFILRTPKCYICKGCLSKMIDMLNKAQCDAFQPDFDKARADYEYEEFKKIDTRDEQFGPMCMIVEGKC
jgi:hypothetical protein